MSERKNLPKKQEIFNHWRDKLPEHGIYVDWHECSCWACGEFYNGKYDDPEAKDPWNKIPLHRCHIKARQFDGTDDLDNLMLLCETCHIESPDTIFREHFLTWVRNRESFVETARKKFEDEIKNLDIT